MIYFFPGSSDLLEKTSTQTIVTTPAENTDLQQDEAIVLSLREETTLYDSTKVWIEKNPLAATLIAATITTVVVIVIVVAVVLKRRHGKGCHDLKAQRETQPPNPTGYVCPSNNTSHDDVTTIEMVDEQQCMMKAYGKETFV